MSGNGRMENFMVKGLSPGLMGTSMKGNGRMEDFMVKGHSLIHILVVDKNMGVNGRMGNFMVKERSLGAMVISGSKDKVWIRGSLSMEDLHVGS